MRTLESASFPLIVNSDSSARRILEHKIRVWEREKGLTGWVDRNQAAIDRMIRYALASKIQTIPDIYLSYTSGEWTVIQKGIPVMAATSGWDGLRAALRIYEINGGKADDPDVWMGMEGQFYPLSTLYPPKLPAVKNWREHADDLLIFLRRNKKDLRGVYAKMFQPFEEAVFAQDEANVKSYLLEYKPIDPHEQRPNWKNRSIGIIHNQKGSCFVVSLQGDVFWLWKVYISPATFKNNSIKLGFSEDRSEYGLKEQRHPTKENMLEVGIVPIGYNPVTGTFSKPLDR